ncbi:MAG: hypothetical protein MJ219_01595 [Mycoplasmoidaceae bacterium]|nr:hypothetical protein [Mycoplasmoidaceae bacterium]
MKKMKLLSSFLGLGLIAGVMSPIVTSCGQNHEEDPVKKQCYISLDDDCADQFTLGVSKIPEGHTLLTTIVATDRY